MPYPPRSVSLAVSGMFVVSFLTGLGAVAGLADGDVVAGVLAAVVATLLYMSSQRLSLGEAVWWYVALALLVAGVLLALANGSATWWLLVTGLPLACLLTPSARRFYAAPAPETTAAES